MSSSPTFTSTLVLCTSLLYWNIISRNVSHTNMCILKAIIVSAMAHYSIILHIRECSVFGQNYLCNIYSELLTDACGNIFVAFEVNDLLFHGEKLNFEMIYHHICHIILAVYMRHGCTLTVVCTILLLQDTSSIFLNLYLATKKENTRTCNALLCIFAFMFFMYRVVFASTIYVHYVANMEKDYTLLTFWSCAHGLQLFWFQKLVRKLIGRAVK